MGKRTDLRVRSFIMQAPRAETWFAGFLAVVIEGCASTAPPPDPPSVDIEPTRDEATAMPAPRPREASKPQPTRRGHWPPPDDERHAKKLAIEAFKAAQRHFHDGDWADAALHFEKADFYVAGALPKFRLAECYDKLGDRRRALIAYQQFIDSNPSERYDDRVALAQKRIRELETTR